MGKERTQYWIRPYIEELRKKATLIRPDIRNCSIIPDLHPDKFDLIIYMDLLFGTVKDYKCFAAIGTIAPNGNVFTEELLEDHLPGWVDVFVASVRSGESECGIYDRDDSLFDLAKEDGGCFIDYPLVVDRSRE